MYEARQHLLMFEIDSNSSYIECIVVINEVKNFSTTTINQMYIR